MQIRTMENRDKPQVRALWQLCFGDTDAFADWFFEKRWRPSYGVVAEKNGQIAAAMQGWPNTLQIRGRTIPACMLAGVSTHPAFRGRGLMKRCLAQFLHAARLRGELAVFQRPVDFAVYEGCMEYPAARAAFLERECPNAGIVPSVPADACDALELLPLYKAAVRPYSGAVVRSEADMHLKLEDYAADGGRVILLPSQGYAVFYNGESRVECVEFAAGDFPVRDALLRQLEAVAAGKTLRVKLPPLLAVPDTALRPSGAMGSIHVPELLRQLAGFSDVTVAVTDALIPENCGVFTFAGEKTDATADISMDAGRLAQLLCGYCSLAELAEQRQATLHAPAATALVDERLPKQPCFVFEEY